MRTDDDMEQDAGRDPLDPEDLATPPEPPVPERPERHERPEHATADAPDERMKEPPRLRENSVRRIRPRGDSSLSAGSADPSDADHADRTSSLGEMLGEERRKRGKTLTDVAMATRIRTRLIEALERGDYDALPSPAYVKGYIQSYAEFLEVPASPLIARFNTEIGGRETTADQHPYIRAPVSLGTTSPTRRVFGGGNVGRGGVGRRSSFPIPTGRVWLLVVALIVVVLTAIGVAALLARSQSVGTIPSPATTQSPSPTRTGGAPATSTAPSTPASGAAGSTNTTASAKIPPGSFAVSIGVKRGNVSWVRVTVDGKKAYEGQLTGGGKSRPPYVATSLVVVEVARPGVVEISRDGKPVTIPQSTTGLSSVRLAAQ